METNLLQFLLRTRSANPSIQILFLSTASWLLPIPIMSKTSAWQNIIFPSTGTRECSQQPRKPILGRHQYILTLVALLMSFIVPPWSEISGHLGQQELWWCLSGTHQKGDCWIQANQQGIACSYPQEQPRGGMPTCQGCGTPHTNAR